MKKNKHFLVISMLAVYFSLIGANLVWQHGDKIFGTSLSAAVLTQDQQAALDAKNDKAESANIAAKNAGENLKAQQAARDAQAELQKASQTDSAKEANLQKNANQIENCKQNPSACVSAPEMPPTYLKPLQAAEKAKKQKETLEGMQQQNQIANDRKKQDVAIMQAQVEYSERNNVPISPQLANKFETTNTSAYDDCIAQATALSDRDVAKESSDESAQTIVSDLTTIEEDADTGLKNETLGTDTIPPLADQDQLTGAAITKEQNRQLAIEAQCESLKAPMNGAPAGSKNYSAFKTNLNILSAGIETSSALLKTSSDAAIAKSAAEITAAKQQSIDQQLANTKQAVGAQKSANNAAAKNNEKPKTPVLPIGTSNLKSDGVTHVYDYCETDTDGNCVKDEDGNIKILDVIPIYADKYGNGSDQTGKYLIPSWNYNTNVTTADGTGLTVYGTAADGTQITNPSVSTLEKITSGTGAIAGSSSGGSSGGSSSGGSSGGSSSGGSTDDVATAKLITKTGTNPDGTEVTLSIENITIRDAGICLEYTATCQNSLDDTTAVGDENSSPTAAAENCLNELATTLNLTGTSGSSSSGGSSSGGSSSGGSSSGGSSSGGSSSGGTGGGQIYTDAEIIEMRKEHFSGGIYHDMDFSFEIPTAMSKKRTLTDAEGKTVTLTITSVSSNHCGSYLANCTNGSKSVTSPAKNYPLDAAYSCLDKLTAELGL